MSNPVNKEPLTRVLHVYDESDGPFNESKLRLLDPEGDELTLSYFAQRWGDRLEAEALLEREPRPEAVLELKVRICEDDPVARDVLKRNVLPWLRSELRLDEDSEE